MHGAVDDFGAHGGFGQICDPENQGAARLQAAEQSGGAQVVGLAGFGSELGEKLDQLAQMGCAAPGQQALLDCLAVGQQPYAVAGK